MCSSEQRMSQLAVSEKPPIPSPFPWGFCQAITADKHHYNLSRKNSAERDCTNSFPTSHWPWGGSAVAKAYWAEICQTCCYKHCKMRMLCSAGVGHSSSPSSPWERFTVVTGLLLSDALWPLNTDKEWQLQRGILNFGLSYMQHLSPHLVLTFRHWPKHPPCRSTARCSQHWQGWLPLICKAFGVFSLATPFQLRSTRCSKQCRNCPSKRSLQPPF